MRTKERQGRRGTQGGLESGKESGNCKEVERPWILRNKRGGEGKGECGDETALLSDESHMMQTYFLRGYCHLRFGKLVHLF